GHMVRSRPAEPGDPPQAPSSDEIVAGGGALLKENKKMAARVAISGFGRIGRNILRAIAESGRTDIEVVGINDLGPVETNAHLLRFDSVHGRFPGTVTVEGDSLSLGHG